MSWSGRCTIRSCPQQTTSLTPISILIAICAILAWALARGWLTRSLWPFYRPVALVLSWGLVADIARACMQAAVLQPARAALGPDLPYPWLARLAFHFEQALMVSWPLALLAGAVVIFLRRSPRPIAGSWGALSVVLALAYPWLRHERLYVAYVILSLGCCVAIARIAMQHVRSEAWLQHHVALLVLTLGEAGAHGAYLLGEPVRDWGIARVSYATALAYVACYQIAQMVRYSRWRRF